MYGEKSVGGHWESVVAPILRRVYGRYQSRNAGLLPQWGMHARASESPSDTVKFSRRSRKKPIQLEHNMQMDEENAAAVLCKEKKEGRSEGQSEEGTEHLRLLDHFLRIYNLGFSHEGCFGLALR